jgi:hypothetical protein
VHKSDALPVIDKMEIKGVLRCTECEDLQAGKLNSFLICCAEK